jgi:hypothetical protein
VRHMAPMETYRFDQSDYDDNGRHKLRSEFLFTDFIVECEQLFHQRFGPYHANALFGNGNVHRLIKSCINDTDNVIFGMEGVDGDFDVDLNLKLESYSADQTVYAIGSGIEGRDDEPLLLVSDNSFSNNQFALKLVSDNESDDIVNDIPVLRTKVKRLH